MMHSVRSSSFQFKCVKFVFSCGHRSDRSPSRECVLGTMHSVRSSRGGRTRRCRGRTCARSWISCASSGFSLRCQVTSDSRLVQTSGCEPCVVCVPSVSLLQCRPHDRANVRPGAAGESAAFEANCGEGTRCPCDTLIFVGFSRIDTDFLSLRGAPDATYSRVRAHWRVSLAGKKAPYSPGRGPGVHATP